MILKLNNHDMIMCHSVKLVLISLDKSSSSQNEWSDRKLIMTDRNKKSHYSPEKLCHNRICCPSNRSKQVQETHTAYIADTQYTRQSLNEKQHAWLHRQCHEWHVAEKVNHPGGGGHSLKISDGYVRPHWPPFSNRLSLNDPLFIFHILLSHNDPHFQNALSLNDPLF